MTRRLGLIPSAIVTRIRSAQTRPHPIRHRGNQTLPIEMQDPSIYPSLHPPCHSELFTWYPLSILSGRQLKTNRNLIRHCHTRNSKFRICLLKLASARKTNRTNTQELEARGISRTRLARVLSCDADRARRGTCQGGAVRGGVKAGGACPPNAPVWSPPALILLPSTPPQPDGACRSMRYNEFARACQDSDPFRLPSTTLLQTGKQLALLISQQRQAFCLGTASTFPASSSLLPPSPWQSTAANITVNNLTTVTSTFLCTREQTKASKTKVHDHS
jgi:hypothetical protein